VLSKDRPERTMGRIMRAWELRRFHLIISLPLIEEIERNPETRCSRFDE